MTRVGLSAGIISLLVAGGGFLSLQRAWKMTAPAVPAVRTVRGTVAGVIGESCGSANRQRPCYRLAIDYRDAGVGGQVVTRTAYNPAPAARGEGVDVVIEADGTGWFAREWNDRRQRERDEHERARKTPLVLGWILVACGGAGLLLAAGLTFWVDTSA